MAFSLFVCFAWLGIPVFRNVLSMYYFAAISYAERPDYMPYYIVIVHSPTQSDLTIISTLLHSHSPEFRILGGIISEEGMDFAVHY